MRNILYFFLIAFIFSCKNDTTNVVTEREIPPVVRDSSDFREFRVLDSRYISKEELWQPFNKDLEDFTEVVYNNLKSLILEQDIPTLQKLIANGDLSYELLTKFYLYRIRKFDRENDLSLNSVIAINPNVIEEAKQKDSELRNKMAKHPIFGMPILLKDNINASGMPTTAGAVALKDNNTELTISLYWGVAFPEITKYRNSGFNIRPYQDVPRSHINGYVSELSALVREKLKEDNHEIEWQLKEDNIQAIAKE